MRKTKNTRSAPEGQSISGETQPGRTAKTAWLANIRVFLAGLITGGADNDPGGISTYIVVAARTGYSQLWIMILAAPMMIAVQAMCARIGDITNQGLGTVIRKHFPGSVAYSVISMLVITTILIIGADLIGVGAALELITGVKTILWLVPVAVIIWLSVLFLNFEAITRYLAVVSLVFLGYIISAVLAQPNWCEVLHNIFLPPIQLGGGYTLALIAILGATFTPPLFFWQTKGEVEEEGTNKQEKARKANVLIAPGFVFGQLVTVFIMIASAATLHAHHQTVQTAQDAARALEPLAGPAAKYLFAVGLIGSGLIAIPVLATSTGYMVAETFGWLQSLSEQVDQAKGFYIVITLSLFAGVEVALTGLDPVRALLYSQVLAGITGPVLILILLILANKKSVMRKYTNGWFNNLFGGLALLVMTASVVLLLVQLFRGGIASLG